MTSQIKIKLIIASLAIILVPSLALATTDIADLLNKAGEGAGFDTSQPAETALASTMGLVVNTFLSIVGVIFISYTIYGGFSWMTAAGNDEKLSKAKNTVRSGIIGLIVILAGWAIYQFIFNALTSST